VECADFVERELALEDGRLRRSWMDSRPGPAGYLEDHAYCVSAYLTLYEFGGDERWFVRAREIAHAMHNHFVDDELGGFFSVADDHEALIVRRKDIEDNPIPSGNSAAAYALLRLSALTGEQRYRDAATRALQQVQRITARLPLGFGHALGAIDFYLGPVREVALVGPAEERAKLRAALLKDYRPKVVVAERESADGTEVPLLLDRGAIDGHAAAFVCEGFVCKLPVIESAELLELLSP
jgi:uncharacterized protein YyaL (SSP411 family)